MHSERNFTECTFAKQFNKLVKVQSGWRDRVLLFDVRFYVLLQTIAFLCDWIVKHDFCRLLDAVVVNIDAQIFALSTGVDHYLDIRHFDTLASAICALLLLQVH